ncbi:hypothetical protein EB796_016487 [Bugula neritina]|uniref:CTCK domain-containing protein n=1 Tax=Bugula neritina TaxID=10212 RepID=A0A7J7JGI5_BUGNE|nr:hypothetical protein EB796_016487 [Bugula neritina]
MTYLTQSYTMAPVTVHTSAYIRLHTYVCIHRSAYIRLHTYVCVNVYKGSYGSVKPTECHPVPVFERVTRDNCRSKYHVDLRQCQGSCGDEIGDCCVPDKNSTISVVTNCKEDGGIQDH